MAQLGLKPTDIAKVQNATASELEKFANEIIKKLQSTVPQLKTEKANIQKEISDITGQINTKTIDLINQVCYNKPVKIIKNIRRKYEIRIKQERQWGIRG